MPAARTGPDTPPPEISKQSSQSLCAEGEEKQLPEVQETFVSVRPLDLGFWSFHEKFNFGNDSRKVRKKLLNWSLSCTCYRGGGGVHKVLTCLAERGAHEQKLAVGHLYLLQKSPQEWSLWIHNRPHPCKKTQENKFRRGFGTEVSISFTLQFPAHYFRIMAIKNAHCFSHELEMKHTFHPNDSTKTNIEINTVQKCPRRNLLLGGGGM